MLTGNASAGQDAYSGTALAPPENQRRCLSDAGMMKFQNHVTAGDDHFWNLSYCSAPEEGDLLMGTLYDYFSNLDAAKGRHTFDGSSGLYETADLAEGSHVSSLDDIYAVRHSRRAAGMMIAMKNLISEAEDGELIITILEFAGLKSIGARLRYLKRITCEDPEDPPIDTDSLRMSALFITENLQLPAPQITISHDGLVYLRWLLRDDEGVLGMEFSPSELIRFTAILHASNSNPERQSISGFMSQKDMMNALRPFIDRLVRL